MTQFKITPHAWGNIKGISWQVCRACGLVRLRNPLTEWCVKQGRDHAEHLGYKSAVATLGRSQD